MIRQFCDRCGSEIKEPNPAWLSRRIFYGKRWIDRRFSKRSEENTSQLLCSRCEGSYYEWFNHPERDEER